MSIKEIHPERYGGENEREKRREKLGVSLRCSKEIHIYGSTPGVLEEKRTGERSSVYPKMFPSSLGLWQHI